MPERCRSTTAEWSPLFIPPLDIFNMVKDGNNCIEFQSQQTTFQLLHFDSISLISCRAANENNTKKTQISLPTKCVL